MNSCLAQDIPQEEYEIICVDDRSTDKSYAVLLEYETKYKNIVVFRHDQNRGKSAARNTGMDNMHGKYCWFIDADDFIADNCLNAIIQMLESGCEMVSVGQAIIRSEENKERHYYLDKKDYRGARVPGYITLRILNSSLLQGLQFQLNLAYGQDEVFYFEVLKRKPKTNIFDHPIYFYRLSNEQSMNLNNNYKKCSRIAAIGNSMKYLFDKYTYDDADARDSLMEG